MKKNVIFRIAAIVLMCTLVTACFASSTFARYTSQASGTASLTVAKWSFKVNNTEIATNDQSDNTNVTFNLADTILDTKDGNAETDVKTGLIAPGTKGSFKFSVQNTSDVTVEYTVALTPSLNSVPVKFYSDSACTTEITDLSAAISGTLAKNQAAAQDTATIYWAWAYGEDVDDNAYGVTPTTISVAAAITATQVD